VNISEQTKDALLGIGFWVCLVLIGAAGLIAHSQINKLTEQVASQTSASAINKNIQNNRKTQWIVLNPNLFGSPLTVSFETNTWDVFVTNDFQGAAILFKRKETKP